MQIKLTSLRFGALAAEGDEALEEYFVESESYRRLLSGERSVVLGNRGSGKSAIFRMIASAATRERMAVISLAPEDYSYELLTRTLAAENHGAWAKHGAYAAAWKFLIYVLVMKALVDGKGLKRGAAAKIYSYLRDNHKGLETNPIGTLISYLKRLEGFKVGKYEAGAKTKELQSLYKLEEISGLLEPLNELCGQRHAIVLVDELDKGWDASEDAVAFIAGLFQAAVSINQRTPNIRVLLSLRKELYDNIPALYEDAQKVRDLVEEIYWDEDSLFELIGRRISHAIDSSASIDPGAAWAAVFSDTLEYRQNKSFNYMVDRTLYRPREIIQFCQETVDQAQEHHEAPPLNYTSISRAEHRYSENRLKDIAAEYRFQAPGLLSVFETFRGGWYNLERPALENHCVAIATGQLRVDLAARGWIDSMDHDHIIDLLWRVGFLKARAVGGLKARRRSGSEYLGSYQISNLNLPSIARFHIHPTFRAYLGTKEKKGPTFRKARDE